MSRSEVDAPVLAPANPDRRPRIRERPPVERALFWLIEYRRQIAIERVPDRVTA